MFWYTLCLTLFELLKITNADFASIELSGDNAVGIAGDWTQAMYGTVEGVKVDYSADATLVTGESGSEEYINLFQQNMFAVRAEIEVGFVADEDCFNILTAAAASA